MRGVLCFMLLAAAVCAAAVGADEAVRSPPCVGLPCASPRLPLDRVRERRAGAHTAAARASRLTRVVKRAEPALRCVSEGREAGGRDGGETAAAAGEAGPATAQKSHQHEAVPC